MHDLSAVQIFEALHDLNRVDSHQSFFEGAEAIQDLSDRTTGDHLEDDVDFIFTMSLQGVVLHDVRVVQILKQVYLVLYRKKLLLTTGGVGLA